MTTLYYMAKPGSEIHRQVVENEKVRKAAVRQFRGFVKAKGLPRKCEPAAFLGGHLFGVLYDDKPGSPWRWGSRERCWLPRLNTKKGKALQQELGSIGPFGLHDFREKWSRATFKTGDVISGRVGRFAVCQHKGDVVIVEMHSAVKRKARRWPSGLKEITGSRVEELWSGKKP